MHSGWPFSLHTPFPDRWGFEPSIDYQLLPGRKPGVFTDVYGFAQGKNAGAIFAGWANAQLSLYILYTVVIVVNFVCHQLTSSLQELPIINMSH